MNMKLLVGAMTAAMMTVSAPASAQIGLEANGARADGRWGGEIGIGYSIPIVAGLKVVPAGGVLVYAEDNGRYYRDDNGGNERCRDGNTGRYADSGLCDNTAVRAYGRVEALYSLPLVATFGAGVRFGDEVKPYGTVALPITPRLQLKGNVGDEYYAIGLRLGF